MGDYTIEIALRRFRETTEDEGTTDIPRPMLDGLVAFGYLTRRRAGSHGYVYTETAKATALLARQEGEDDSVRLDWLERHIVEVREPLRYGSAHMFYALQTNDEGEPYRSDLRARVDAARSGGGG